MLLELPVAEVLMLLFVFPAVVVVVVVVVRLGPEGVVVPSRIDLKTVL